MGGKLEKLLVFQTEFSGGDWKLRGGKGKKSEGAGDGKQIRATYPAHVSVIGNAVDSGE